jgi:hypothetical protein
LQLVWIFVYAGKEYLPSGNIASRIVGSHSECSVSGMFMSGLRTVSSPGYLCRSCAAAPRLSCLSHFTAGSRPRLTQMPPLRGWFIGNATLLRRLPYSSTSKRTAGPSTRA